MPWPSICFSKTVGTRGGTAKPEFVDRRLLARLADVLTASRLVIAGAILVLGLLAGPAALGSAFLLTLIAWTTDLFDGVVARWSGPHPRTLLARWDLGIDILLVGATLTFVILAGLLHPAIALLYPLAIVAARRWFHSTARLQEINTLAHAVTFGAIVVGAPSLIVPLLAWIAAILIAFRRRAAQELDAFLRRHSIRPADTERRDAFHGKREPDA